MSKDNITDVGKWHIHLLMRVHALYLASDTRNALERTQLD